MSDAIRNAIAREWLAHYNNVRHPAYDFADAVINLSSLGHQGDCPRSVDIQPMTCSGCMLDDACGFAAAVLSAITPVRDGVC